MPEILYIEDSRAFQRLMTKYLPAPYQLTVVDSLPAGWAAIQARKFDLVIADYLFPEGDALELIFKIRSVASPLELPVLILSSAADRFLASKFFSAGANATVGKPPNVQQFRELVAKMLAAPWIEKPDFPSIEAHLIAWSTATEAYVYCPSLRLETRGNSPEAALHAMHERIQAHRRDGGELPIITTPKQSVFFSPNESAAPASPLAPPVAMRG